MRKLAARRRKATDINVAIAEIDCDPEVPLDHDTIRAALKTCALYLLMQNLDLFILYEYISNYGYNVPLTLY